MPSIQVNPLILKMHDLTGRKHEMRCYKVDKTDKDIIVHYRKYGKFLTETFKREEWVASSIVSDDPSIVETPAIVPELPKPQEEFIPLPPPVEIKVEAPPEQTPTTHIDPDVLSPAELQLLGGRRPPPGVTGPLNVSLPGEYNARAEMEKWLQTHQSLTGLDGPEMMQAQINAEYAIQEGRRLSALRRAKYARMQLVKDDG